MATIHFVREPGFTYDLFFCFILYFNREYCMTEYINQNKAKQDTDFLNRLLAAVGHIPDELGLFFRVRKDGRSFMTNTFFGPYKDCFATTYDLTIVREALTDVPRLVGQLLDFYFPGKRETVEVQPTAPQISAWIRESAYDASLKSSLYAFFFEPAVVAGLLSQELEAKASIASRLYVENAALLVEQKQKFDLEALREQLRNCGNLQFDLDFPCVYVSFCLLAKNHIYGTFFEKHVVLCLGYDYKDLADYVNARYQQAALGTVGGAPEENTQSVALDAVEEQEEETILSLIEQVEEVTASDIIQRLGFTSANLYYHLTIMLKVNILRSCNRGPTIYYSLNRNLMTVKTARNSMETTGEETGGWQISVFNSF